MNPVDWALVIGAAGIVLSVLGSVLTVGIAWGLMRGELHAVQSALASGASSVEVQVIAGRLGRIEGLFEYRLSEQATGRHGHGAGHVL